MNSSQKHKIALVEDDANIREMYKMKLELSGYNIITAENGKEAMELVKKENPELVLLDILLPKKDGFEVLKEIKDSKDEKVKSIPVVMLSNLSSKEDISEAKKLGASDYFVKAKIAPGKVAEKVKRFFE
jgi:DNA-binding response OmpR family regulator